MAVKFFGQFLLEKGVVSSEILLQAVKLQESVNLKFGEVALAAKLIAPADVERIHNAQRAKDLKFGDMAVKLGILSDEQVSQVLTLQKKSHLYIGEALVKVGGLADDDLPRYLDEFKIDQAPYVTDKIAIPPGFPHPEIWEMLADLTYKMLTRIAGVQCRLGECRSAGRLPAHAMVAAMDLQGDAVGRCLFAVSPGTREKIARAILKEESVAGESEEILDDTVMEFLNIVCGNVAAKAAQRGKAIDILPPLTFHPGGEGIAAPPDSLGLFFDLHLADGEKAELAVFLPK